MQDLFEREKKEKIELRKELHSKEMQILVMSIGRVIGSHEILELR